jgi:phosphatidylserine/phosphatidylglycerophosphate/cardiolipin synthase-like enzyme
MQGLANYLQDGQARQSELQQKLEQTRQEQRRTASVSADGLTKDGDLVPPQDMPGMKVLVCTLVAPDMPAGKEWDYVYIHQKLMIVDDVFTTHGSANVNRRSMEVDSELNICHEHGGATRALRKQLWALHTNDLGAQDDIPEAYKQWSRVIFRNTQNQGNKLPPVASVVGFLRTSPKRTYAD